MTEKNSTLKDNTYEKEIRKKIVEIYMTPGITREEMFDLLAKFYIAREKEGILNELKIAQAKIVLTAYHSGHKVDVSWLEHRIKELEEDNG